MITMCLIRVETKMWQLAGLSVRRKEPGDILVTPLGKSVVSRPISDKITEFCARKPDKARFHLQRNSKRSNCPRDVCYSAIIYLNQQSGGCFF